MKDYKIISRFYRMTALKDDTVKTYILLAHGVIAAGNIGTRNIHSVVKPGQRLLTKLYTPTGHLVLPLLSDLCKNGLNNPLITNVKVSACKDTIEYAGLYECNMEEDGLMHPTRIISFHACQSFTLIDLYDQLTNPHRSIRLIFVGCIGPVPTGPEHSIDRTYVIQVDQMKINAKYTKLEKFKEKKAYESNLMTIYPSLSFKPEVFFIFNHPINPPNECKEECNEDCATQEYIVPDEQTDDEKENPETEQPAKKARALGGRRKTKNNKKKKRLSKHSRKKKHTRRLNRRV